jgi:hypothetical protein
MKAVEEKKKAAKEKKEEKLGEKVSELIAVVYRDLIKDKFPSKKSFEGNAVISNYTELCLIAQYEDLYSQEQLHFKRLGQALEDYPIYTEYLSQVRGIGPAMAGCIISEFDIHKSKYPSSLWKYCGLDVAPNGKGRTRKPEHLVDVVYKDKDGVNQIKKSITFNPFIKTKMVGVLSSCFLRNNNEKYVKVYQDYKNRLNNTEGHKDKTLFHINNMAKRYMIKMFLQDLYVVWRTMEGLEVSAPWNEVHNNHKHNEGRDSRDQHLSDGTN